jgi:hypothetical protein
VRANGGVRERRHKCEKIQVSRTEKTLYAKNSWCLINDLSYIMILYIFRYCELYPVKMFIHFLVFYLHYFLSISTEGKGQGMHEAYDFSTS